MEQIIKRNGINTMQFRFKIAASLREVSWWNVRVVNTVAGESRRAAARAARAARWDRREQTFEQTRAVLVKGGG